MSVRSRLRIFFLFIVAIPMLAVALLLIRVSGELGEGRVQTQLAQAAQTAIALHEREASRLDDEARELAAELERRRAWRLGAGELAAILRAGVDDGHYRSAALLGPQDRVLRRIGPKGGLHSAVIRFRIGPRKRGPVAAVALAGTAADTFVARLTELTGAETILIEGEEELASSDPTLLAAERQLKGEERWRGRRVSLGGDLSLMLLRAQPPADVLESQPFLVGAFALLLLAGLGFALVLSRTMHEQVAAMLAAARRIGAGDFTARVPADGNDELAGLGSEFNRMAELVELQFERITDQEHQLRRSIRRLGEAMASGMNREGLLELALLMTVEACGADYGRLRPEGEPELEVEEAEFDHEEEHVALDDEARRLIARLEESATEQPCREQAGRWHALAARLRHEGSEGGMVLLRADAPFNDTEAEIFGYLTSQVAVSLENLRLYRQLEREAITDELTELANRRRFNQLLAHEVARARRFAHPLCLVLMDIDDFKQINDTLGHPKGDEVLRELAGILRAETRSIDEPARYGGEEFAVLLPETDLEGALQLAERIRRRIEEGTDDPAFTVSVGVAELAEKMRADELVERADAALYRAKGEGKNRVASE